ncbi:MAG: RDD family protein [Streptosporangiaceae bacterium]
MAEPRSTIRVGYEQFVPPPVPPGMWFDRDTWLILPQGVRRASKGRVAAAYALAVGLFIATVGVGYLIWAAVAWGQGQTPAQRLLGLRCWRRDTGRVAGRKHMALRQVTGLFLNGELLMGPLIWLGSKELNSVGDFFAGTVVLYDPNQLLHR